MEMEMEVKDELGAQIERLVAAAGALEMAAERLREIDLAAFLHFTIIAFGHGGARIAPEFFWGEMAVRKCSQRGRPYCRQRFFHCSFFCRILAAIVGYSVSIAFADHVFDIDAVHEPTAKTALKLHRRRRASLARLESMHLGLTI